MEDPHLESVMAIRKLESEADFQTYGQVFLGYVVYSAPTRTYLTHRSRREGEPPVLSGYHPAWAHRYDRLEDAMGDATLLRNGAVVMILADQAGEYCLHEL